MDTMQAPRDLPVEDTTEMEERRIQRLNDADINEMDVLAQARDNLNIWQNYFNENMTRGKDDMNFCLRDQWTAIERSEFNRLFKVCFTFNKMLDPINKIVGEQRKNKPDLMVRSLTGRASQDDINLRADLVRTIAYQSQNDLVYQNAFRFALLMGWGSFQVDVDYESPRSFNKIIKYLSVPDPTRCSWDPSAVKPHKGDGDYCSRQYIYSREQFDATYPYIYNPVSYADPRMFLDFQWETRDTIVVCDYFVKEWFPLKLLKLSDGRNVSEMEWEEIKEKEIEVKKELAASSKMPEVILETIPRIMGERQTQDYKIMRYRLIKDRIIEFSEWPSKYLPIIFVDGNSHFVEGRQYTKSFIHEGRDAQKFINYVGSEIATEIKNRRREQWMGTPDNIIGEEQQWRNPELQQGILVAKPDPVTKQMPIKMPEWNISPQLMQEMQRGGSDLREILGFSENEVLQGRDMSGKARRERKMEGSMATYVWMDNLNQAIEQGGRCTLDLLPYVVGEDERAMVITKKDGKTQNIVLNKERSDGTIENAVTHGDYDIELSTGPSFAVQKEIALEFFQQTLAANPETFPLIADLWAKNLDVQYMEQIAERFKIMVPPEVLAKEEGKEPPPKQPTPQEQAMQMEMEFKKAELAEKQKKLELEMEELELKKAKLMLEAQKVQMDSELNVYDHQANIQKSQIAHGLENQRAEMDYTAKIAKVVADMHKNDQKITSK
jgi:Phage P22-like portal protein